MNFSEVLRSFFGLNNNNSGSNSNLHNDFRNPIWNIDDDDDTDDELHHHFSGDFGDGSGSFHGFSNPTDMQRLLEQKLSELVKSLESILEPGKASTPAIQYFPILPDQEKKEKSLRDEYLKPKIPTVDLFENTQKVDTDLDGKITSSDLNSFFKNEGGLGSSQTDRVVKKGPLVFSRTIIRKSVLLPDGNVETTQTVKKSDGREETTVTISPRHPWNEDAGHVLPLMDSIWKNFFGF